jgi:hypothetical protein
MLARREGTDQLAGKRITGMKALCIRVEGAVGREPLSRPACVPGALGRVTRGHRFSVIR